MAVGLRPDSPTELGVPAGAASKSLVPTEMEVDGETEGRSTQHSAFTNTSSNKVVENVAISSQRRRRRILLSTESVFVDNILPSLLQNPDVELRLITDEPSALLAGANKIPHYMDTVDSQTFEKKTGARRWLKAKAAELSEWADMLLVAPIDAGTLEKNRLK